MFSIVLYGCELSTLLSETNPGVWNKISQEVALHLLLGAQDQWIHAEQSETSPFHHQKRNIIWFSRANRHHSLYNTIIHGNIDECLQWIEEQARRHERVAGHDHDQLLVQGADRPAWRTSASSLKSRRWLIGRMTYDDDDGGWRWCRSDVLNANVCITPPIMLTI